MKIFSGGCPRATCVWFTMQPFPTSLFCLEIGFMWLIDFDFHLPVFFLWKYSPEDNKYHDYGVPDSWSKMLPTWATQLLFWYGAKLHMTLIIEAVKRKIKLSTRWPSGELRFSSGRERKTLGSWKLKPLGVWNHFVFILNFFSFFLFSMGY